ncbi:MAG: hypothetical protein CMM55_03600 [Rhodospirillaceae bacterium]|nr:hypothetical protein [Rhodospirillaceae bacterium]
MSNISGEFVTMMARIWHRFSLPQGDAALLAEMLAPMETAGEEVAENLQFDMEPSDFDRALEELAPPIDER